MMRRVAGLLALLLLSGGAGAQEVRFIGIGSGGVTGVYYPAGLGICRLVNADRREHGLRCAVEASQGSVYNLRAVRSGALEFGLAQSDAQEAALKGEGAFAADGPDPALRAVFSLHAEPLHLMAHAEAGVGAVADLAGKRVNIGAEGSGARALSELLLQGVGLSTDDVEAAALKSTEQAAALCERRIDAAIWPAGVPNRSAAEATATCAIRLVALEMPASCSMKTRF
jgi:TRAP transporter TAXI family solute receptor